MAKNTTISVVDAAEKGAPSSSAVRAQAAMVRALADEVERRHPSDGHIAAVRGQLGDELARFSGLVATSASVAPPDVDAAPLGVLVVDDDSSALAAMVEAVRLLGYRCAAACSGHEALRAYARSPADIVVADWNMPGLSGLELCRDLKAREDAPYVILVTADQEKGDQLQGEGMPDDFLAKPLDVDELEARLRSADRLLRSLQSLGKVLASQPPPSAGA